MAKPFNEGMIEGGGRLLGRKKAEACSAIEALLVGADRVTDVSPEAIVGACNAARLNSPIQLRKECKAIYGRYLDYCFEDKMLSLEEMADLAHLKTILQLTNSDANSIQDEVAIAVYGRAVAEVLDDLKIDPEEAEFLRRLREDLSLPDSKADRILEEGARDARGRALREATASDETFVDRREAAGSFTGRSADSLEAAVNDAIAKANLAIPQLQWFEVSQISGYVEGGSASQWYVVLQAGIERDSR